MKLFACTGTWGYFVKRSSLVISDSKENAEREFLATDFKGYGDVSTWIQEVSQIGDYRILLVKCK